MKVVKYTFAVVCALTIFSCAGDNDSTSNETSSNEDVTDSVLVEETEIDEKKENLLRSLIGEHKLVSISGFTGANTMMDYWVENEEWTASGSSISGGMREGYDIELTEETIKKLNSAKMVVTDDLEVYYYCAGNQYFNSAFNPSGMNYKVKGDPKDYITGIPDSLTSNTTFLGEELFIYAEDQIEESIIKPIDIADVWADAVTITVNSEKSLTMYLFYGDCCDGAFYTFE